MIRPVLALVLIAGAANAEVPIRVQSGEHESFTRLVLSADPSRDWDLTNGDGQAEFVLRGEAIGFDISTVFNRIPRDRLAALSVQTTPRQSSLLLEFGCDCAVEAFAYQGAYIVLDIAQRDPDAAPPVARPTPRQSPALFAQRYDEIAPRIGDIGIESFAEPLTADILDRPENPTPPPAPDSAVAARIAEAQDALLTQLTRAAEQGLIEFSPPASALHIAKQRKKPAPAIAPPPLPSPGLARQISARTVYDRDSATALAEIVNDFARTYCMDDAEFDLAQWGGAADFNTTLGQLHSAMVEERDRPLPLAATDLVRFYLRYGLGREARSLLDSYGLAAENPVLAELALVADGEVVPRGGILDLGRGCGGAHELWRILALPDAVDTLPLEIESVLAAFAALPLDLRMAHIGRLVGTFSALGATDVAQRALDLVARAGQAETPALQLIRAEMLLASEPAAAEDLLASLVEGDSDSAPAAMLLWAGSLLGRKAVAPDTLIQSLAAAAFERRSTAQGRDLRLAEIQLRATAEGFDVALEMIAADLGRDRAADANLRRAAQEIFANATPDPAAASAYVAAIIRHRALLESGRDGDVARREIARQLIGLGLPADALELLADTPDFDAEAQILAARAQLDLFKPQAALDRLNGRDDQRAREVMAAAYMQLGQYGTAYELLAAANSPDNARSDAAFLAGQWADAAQAYPTGQTPEPRAALAAYMRDRGAEVAADASAAPLPPMPDNLPNTLEAARATLESNRASRAYLQGLLAPTPPE